MLRAQSIVEIVSRACNDSRSISMQMVELSRVRDLHKHDARTYTIEQWTFCKYGRGTCAMCIRLAHMHVDNCTAIERA